ncbi:S-adenosyl-L-methionine-dependent methyltransferase [Schizothecium vesticola]|uniref:S-adenosyl-L-methionine-dependent methyltransferase n=1 Tax=Schizothecium vesticola TaxID=314040 RepID=A0AA40KAV8_9PEZI|nr:S-adenosyl-L-methionine-dependent methyltransferase [Schizothecium vesticola]
MALSHFLCRVFQPPPFTRPHHSLFCSRIAHWSSAACWDLLFCAASSYSVNMTIDPEPKTAGMERPDERNRAPDIKPAPDVNLAPTGSDAEPAGPPAPETGENHPDALVARYPDQPEDQDAGFDEPRSDDDASSTASISSSIFEYRKLHGRTYHSNQGNSEYWGTNDEPMNEALDIIHHVLTLLLGGELCKAPISDDIQEVLDVGTGTGLWAIDFADQYPSAAVIGTDLSPIQPNWVPPNVSFQIDDCTRSWTFPENTFDFIHIRWLFGSIVDWDELFREAYRALKPGGWIESHEASTQFRSDDGTMHEQSAMAKFGAFFADGGKKLGRSMTILEDGVQRAGIEAAGFVNVHEQDYKSPLGAWPADPAMREMGMYQQLATTKDLTGTLLYMGNLMGWQPEEIQVYAARLRNEFNNRNIHGYYLQKIVWAQKPV